MPPHTFSSSSEETASRQETSQRSAIRTVDRPIRSSGYGVGTEVLTEKGWKRMEQVTTADAVATLVHEGEFQYITPASAGYYHYSGKLYELRTTQVDLMVHPLQRIYVTQNVKAKHPQYSLVRAEKLFKRQFRMLRNAEWTGTSPEQVEILGYHTDRGERVLTSGAQRAAWDTKPLTVPAADYATLLGAFLSCGHIVNDSRSGSYGLGFSLPEGDRRRRLNKRLKQSLKAIDIPIHEESMRCYSKHLMLHFSPKWRQGIPASCFRWDRELQQKLLDVMLIGSGCWSQTSRRRPRAHAFHSMNRELVADVQRLCLHTGKSANFVVIPAQPFTRRDKRYDGAEAYEARIYYSKNRPTINHLHTQTQFGQSERYVNYDDQVSYVRMPSACPIYIRRNGKPCWSGDCQV